MNYRQGMGIVPTISRTRFNPIRNLKPETLSRALEAFDAGRLGTATRLFEAILSRDDVISGLNLKRKKSVTRLDFEIVMTEKSTKAKEHKKTLESFYENIDCSSFTDRNCSGGIRKLISQMMDCVAMKYSVHKVEFISDKEGKISAKFIRYPLWLFENTSGELRLLESEDQLTPGMPLEKGDWLITCGDALMFPSSVAYLFKELPLKDWLVYCERNGMPGIKAKTDAYPGTEQWNAACSAVEDFGAEFHAVLSQGTDIDAIDVSTRGELPYPALIERIDRIMCSLWRGSDLSTISAQNNSGASIQQFESTIIEEDDAENISETLNRNIDTRVIALAFGEGVRPLAKFRLRLPDYSESAYELDVIERLAKLGMKPDFTEIAKRFAFPLSSEKSASTENGRIPKGNARINVTGEETL